ncbi:Deoxyribose-phosphate aldolase/phospho-2-dehydro-3-deoxyheptonate aldolase [Shigella flexneri]|uniref:Deoxyribose-phosphate aldolase/phospho-2-dehydro-3-deoxyheptonate aldolase n=1 Tax=Shigella flexneri TaxID=623 RepID=A0A380B1Y9_SHIFL|nr:hypothetical protein [Shigella flexneri]EIQ11514.1 resolvase, N terminal domain protein [Shigella flexneri 2850-71]SUI91529.1 Deoxyribose-phosphate aldolase/phospho-2-dehydro-3-deoxyheptonate aldolase [Shigella flexneri]
MLALCDRFETENTDTIDSLKLQREDLQRKISKMAELAIELDDMTIITEKLRDMKNVDWPPESPDNQYHLFK